MRLAESMLTALPSRFHLGVVEYGASCTEAPVLLRKPGTGTPQVSRVEGTP